MSTVDLKANRPLSPHLQIYRWRATMAMSILHRATGIVLFVGTLLLAWWLLAAAGGRGSFNVVNDFFGSWIGLIVLFGYTWALVHHMLGGLRYLLWDTGHGLEAPMRDRLAIANIVGSVALTVFLWIVGLLAW